MPIRGRRPRRDATSNSQSLSSEAPSGSKQVRMEIVTELVRRPYTSFSVVASLSSKGETDFEVTTNVVSRKSTTMSIDTVLVGRSGDTRTIPMFSVTTQLGGEAGYPAAPQVQAPGALVIGQPLRRHREVIPSND